MEWKKRVRELCNTISEEKFEEREEGTGAEYLRDFGDVTKCRKMDMRTWRQNKVSQGNKKL